MKNSPLSFRSLFIAFLFRERTTFLNQAKNSIQSGIVSRKILDSNRSVFAVRSMSRPLELATVLCVVTEEDQLYV